MWEIACVSDKGVRETNDDRILILDEIFSSGKHTAVCKDGVYVVMCDGVGGEKHGDRAAEIALQAFASIKAETVTQDNIQHFVNLANEQISIAQWNNVTHSRMATTIAGVIIKNDSVLIFNVGDTRVYRYREPYIELMSTDHSLSFESRALGLETYDEQKHIITRCLGGAFPKADVYCGNVRQTDSFLMCTDGIWEVVSNTQIEEIFAAGTSAVEIRDRLLEQAIKNESTDNMSIVIARRI